MSDLKVNPERLKLARANATRAGVLSLIESLHVAPDECAMALIQVVGAFIAAQSDSHEKFQQLLKEFTQTLSKLAETHKDELERELAARRRSNVNA